MKKRMAKASAPKAISYVLIPPKSDIGVQMYERLYGLVDEHHEELSRANVRIALAWATSWKADVDGRLTLGKCKKASDLDRELAPYDFVILLNRDFWQNPRVSNSQRSALLDHELMHAAVSYDENGDAKVDERGRTVFRIRKHDLEEFRDIVVRHGCWKSDIEDFAMALARAEKDSSEAFIGPTRLHETLLAIGLDVPVHEIATWDRSECREVMTWALLRQDGGARAVNVTLSSTMPACLAAATRSAEASAAAAH